MARAMMKLSRNMNQEKYLLTKYRVSVFENPKCLSEGA